MIYLWSEGIAKCDQILQVNTLQDNKNINTEYSKQRLHNLGNGTLKTNEVRNTQKGKRGFETTWWRAQNEDKANLRRIQKLKKIINNKILETGVNKTAYKTLWSDDTRGKGDQEN